MKTAIIGFAALGTVLALRPVARRMEQRMRAHCERMAAMLSGRGEPVGKA